MDEAMELGNAGKHKCCHEWSTTGDSDKDSDRRTLEKASLLLGISYVSDHSGDTTE
jgi:hypothetical protein